MNCFPAGLHTIHDAVKFDFDFMFPIEVVCVNEDARFWVFPGKEPL